MDCVKLDAVPVREAHADCVKFVSVTTAGIPPAIAFSMPIGEKSIAPSRGMALAQVMRDPHLTAFGMSKTRQPSGGHYG